MPHPSRALVAPLGLLSLLALLSWTAAADASSRGLSGGGCQGCHGIQDDATASLSPLVADLGTSTTLRFTIYDPDAQISGLFIAVEDSSGLSIPGGQQLAVVRQGITHTSPRDFSGGQVTYEVNWNVPSTPGTMRFLVSALAADGNELNSNDEPVSETFDVEHRHSKLISFC